jgi:hypothetical protein
MAVPRRLLRPFPSSDELAQLTVEELLQVLADFGIDLDVAKLDEAARAAFARAKAAIRDGHELDAAAQEQLSTTITRAFDKELRADVKAIMGDWRGAVLGGDRTEVEQEELWVAVMDTNTCPDCEERHGSERTRSEWEQVGMPRSNALICQDQCRCELFPVSGDAPAVYVEVAALS